MTRKLTALVLVVLCHAGSITAQDRLAILEFFGRPSGAYCSAAGPAMKTLQNEFEGRAVLLEYDYDSMGHERITRFFETGVPAPYLPLVMVGSGYRTSSGNTSYESDYRSMIQDERARTPRAAVAAYWRRVGSSMRTYITMTNTSTSDLRVSEQPAIWTIVYEKAAFGVSNAWVRAESRWPLQSNLAPGASVFTTMNVAASSMADWNRAAGVVFVEDHPASLSRYDMLQASETLPAALNVSPGEISINSASPAFEITLEGPHVLNWNASSNVPWLELSSASGSLPSAVTVTLNPELRPASENSATISFNATGDSMSFSAQAQVTVGAAFRRPTGRRTQID